MSDIADEENEDHFVDGVGASGDASIPPLSGITAKVAVGSLWGTGGQVAILAASILTTPFVLRLLSTEQYGLLSLVNLLLSYLALSDLGMQAASTRFATAAHMQDGDAGESLAVWNSLWITFIPGLAVSAALFVSAGFLADRAFHVPIALHAQAVVAFRIVVVILLARNIIGVANTPQIVRLRFDLYTLISNGGLVAQMLTMPLALYFSSRSVVTAVVVMAVYTVATMVVHIVVSLHLLPALSHPQFSRQGVRDLAGFGVSLMAMGLMAFALSLEKVLLAHLGSLSALAFYSVAYTLASLPMIAANALGQALMPGFTKLYAANGVKGLSDLFYRMIRLLALLILPILFLLCVFGAQVLRLWAGPTYAANGIWPLYILVWGILFDCFCIVPAVVVYAVGSPRAIVLLRLILLAPYLGLAILLISRLGSVGAALAFSGRALAEFVLIYGYCVKRYLEREPLRFAIFKKWAAAIGLLFSPLLLLILRQPAFFRGASLFSVMAYIWFGWTHLLQDAEKSWLAMRWKQTFARLQLGTR